MARFTKELRQQLVREFAEKNGGWFDPAAFLSEVRSIGDAHPAFEWFEWNDDKAAHEFRLDQARDFARGLVVKFEVKTIHRGAFKVTQHTAPLALSPLERRRDSGGYYLTNTDDPAHMDELCRQAAQSLRWFLSRYDAALAHVGANMTVLEKMQSALEHGTEHKRAA